MMNESKEKYKSIVMAILLAGACFLTYYFHVVLNTGTVFTHFFYIPIILASVWWRRKGLGVAIFLAALIIFSHTFIRTEAVTPNDYLRAIMFIAVALVVATLSEKIEDAEAKLRNYAKYLKDEVEERTKDLAKERDYTRHLIESSPDFQMTIDKNGKIMDVNEAFECVVGKSRENLIGSSIYNCLPKEETEKLIAEIFDKEKVRYIELTADIPEKGALIWNLSGTVFATPEGETGIYVSGRDVTEQRRAEKELRAKELQLVHSSRLSSLGEMATGIAHEINQPLSIISMAAEGILRDIKKKRLDVSLLPKDIEDISKNVQRIDRLITHMRTYARQPEEWQSVEPAELLNDAFVMLGEQFRVHNIAVSREVEEGLPAIEVDPHQAEQVFVNILLNARQVLDERGEEADREGKEFEKRLVCCISREKIKEKDYVVFEFADNAYGVPEDQKTRIFEPFFTTKETGEGTGLGLSIAYGIVTRALDGKIWVEDNEMGGASFKVAMPVKDKTTETQRSGV